MRRLSAGYISGIVFRYNHNEKKKCLICIVFNRRAVMYLDICLCVSYMSGMENKYVIVYSQNIKRKTKYRSTTLRHNSAEHHHTPYRNTTLRHTEISDYYTETQQSRTPPHTIPKYQSTTLRHNRAGHHHTSYRNIRLLH